jgi:hypothetical protein
MPFLILIWLVGAYALTVAAYGGLSRPRPAAVAIVLGSAVHEGQPEAPLASRLEAARQAWADTLVHVLFVSGATHGPAYDESAVMRAWLLAHGVPDSVIVRDSLGTTTHDTGVNAAAWMKAHHANDALGGHAVVPRRARHAGLPSGRHRGDGGGGRHASRGRDVTPFVRELVALPVYAVRGLGQLLHR